VDLHVTVHRRLTAAAGRPALVLESFGQLGDRLLEARGDGGEVLLVRRCQRRVGLGAQAVGEGEGAARQ
jgi:hypothetical protein